MMDARERVSATTSNKRKEDEMTIVEEEKGKRKG